MSSGVRQREPALTAAEFARRVGCSEEKARMMLRDGELPGFKVGSHWRVRPEIAEAYQAGQLAPAKPPPVDEQIAEIVRAAPPLTDEQIDKLVILLRTAGTT